jgi:hypothetical protein
VRGNAAADVTRQRRLPFRLSPITENYRFCTLLENARLEVESKNVESIEAATTQRKKKKKRVNLTDGINETEFWYRRTERLSFHAAVISTKRIDFCCREFVVLMGPKIPGNATTLLGKVGATDFFDSECSLSQDPILRPRVTTPAL